MKAAWGACSAFMVLSPFKPCGSERHLSGHPNCAIPTQHPIQMAAWVGTGFVALSNDTRAA